MVRIVGLTIAAVMVATVSSAQSLVGAWTLEETEVTGGDNPGTVEGRPGLMIFTPEHYSSVLARGNPLRPRLNENPTDGELLAAFRLFSANSGTYALTGSTLTQTASVAMNPNNMNTTRTREVRFEGDDTVWFNFTVLDGTVDVTQKWVRAPVVDEAAVNGKVEALYAALNRGDVEGYVAAFDQGAVHAVRTNVAVGPSNIATFVEQPFANGLRVEFIRHGTRILSPDTAIVHGASNTVSVTPPENGHAVLTLVREGDEWLIASLQVGLAASGQ